MYTKGKYVILELSLSIGSTLGALCFAETFGHDLVAEHFVRNHDEVRSAGFFHVNENLTVSVYGESISLRKKSMSEDARLVARALALPEAAI
jgi:hypothetical protein